MKSTQRSAFRNLRRVFIPAYPSPLEWAPHLSILFLLPLVLGERGAEWEPEGRGRPPPPADMHPEWDYPDARFHEHEAGRGRGRGGGGRGGGGRGGRGGRGPPHYGPHGRDRSPPPGAAMERGWSHDDGVDGGGEWGRGAAPPAGDSGGGFQEWSAFDESPPRAAPPRRAPMAAGRGRGHPSGAMGPRGGGGRGSEHLGPAAGDPLDRSVPPHGGEHFDGFERPARMGRREVSMEVLFRSTVLSYDDGDLLRHDGSDRGSTGDFFVLI